MKIEEIESLDTEYATSLVASNHKVVRFTRLNSLSSRAALILSETTADLEFPNLTTITTDAANALVSHSGTLNLSGILNLSSDVAAALAQHNGPLSLPSLLQLSHEAALGLSCCRHATGLAGIKELPETVAEALAACAGALDLSGMSTIADESARLLANHAGTLDLNGLTTLSDAVSEFLGKHDGPLNLNGVRRISVANAEGLAQTSTFLSLDGIEQPNAGTLYLITHITGELSLMGLHQIDQPHLNALMINRRMRVSARISDVVACCEAASMGSADAQYDLGLLFSDDDVLCSEPTMSAHWYRKSAEQGKSEAQCALGMCYIRGEGVDRDYEEAAKWLSDGGQLYWTEAVNGDATAQLKLGDGFKDGLWQLPQDRSEAIKWYGKAAIAKNAQALYNLGDCSAKGEGIPVDLVEAFGWYLLAAEQGHTLAQLEVGHRLQNGIGIELDEPSGCHWLQKAAEQGNVLGQMKLAQCHVEGRGTKRDFTSAAYWYRKAAEMGSADAQYAYAVLLTNGIGIPEDEVAGQIWLRQAAEQDSVEAQVAMAYRCEPRPSPWFRGLREILCIHNITDQDPEEAVKWLTMAAENGDAESMFRLAWYYLTGCGVEANGSTAETWLRKAADKDHKEAKNHVYGSTTTLRYGADRIEADKKSYSYTKLLKIAKEGDVDTLIAIIKKYDEMVKLSGHTSIVTDCLIGIFGNMHETAQIDGAGGFWTRVEDQKQSSKQHVEQGLVVLKSIYFYTPPKDNRMCMNEEQIIAIAGMEDNYMMYIGRVANRSFFRYLQYIPGNQNPTDFSACIIWLCHARRWCLVAAEHGNAWAAEWLGFSYNYYSYPTNKVLSQYWYNQAKKLRPEKGQSVWNRLWSSK